MKLNTIHIRVQEQVRKIANSISFYPAVIAIFFLLLSFATITFDYSEMGKKIKSSLHWLSLSDAPTARSIISAIVAGIISLAVFSFSMVMIMLNQAASQMSNRVLDKLIGNRFQQIVLGIYIGTIVYALFLLSTIRDIDSGVFVPALSTYLLIVITVMDIFLFIYFLHYITQSVKYEVVIRRIYKATIKSLDFSCHLEKAQEELCEEQTAHLIISQVTGIYEGCQEDTLAALCRTNDCTLHITILPGTFVLEGAMVGFMSKPLPDEQMKSVHQLLRINETESIAGNFFYGFRQLMEIAIKALSPGISDPYTAVISLRALFQLYAQRLCRFPPLVISDEDNTPRLILKQHSFEELFLQTLLPIWDHGKDDRIIRNEFISLLTQLYALKKRTEVKDLLERVRGEVGE